MTPREALALTLLVVVLLGPFVGKAYHIDDLYTLAGIENVLRDPLDPIGGTVGWVPIPRPLRQFELNPPFLVYLLAPVAALWGFSEYALHFALLPFGFALAWASLWLGKRFCPTPWFVPIFVMTSTGVMVSGNVMRDLPALALGSTAVATSIAGSDSARPRLLLLGAVLAGLALLTKYSAVVFVGLIALYPLLQRRPRELRFVAVPLAMFALWCLHSGWMYGEAHPLAIARGGLGPLRAWRDNLCGLSPVIGSLCLLSPALLLCALKRRDTRSLWVMAATACGVGWGTAHYLGGAPDGEYLFWSQSGAALLAGCLTEGVRGARSAQPGESAADSTFLLAWAGAAVLFSLFFVPFQAVRHLIAALPALVLLALRALDRMETRSRPAGLLTLTCLAGLQALLGFSVAIADYDHANALRRFASSQTTSTGTNWAHGSWGFAHYAAKAGLPQLSPRPPYPVVGDRVVQPRHANRSVDVVEHPALARYRLEALESWTAEGRVPFRTIHADGANFYAVVARRGEELRPALPFRWLSEEPVEVLEVFEVRPR